MKLEDLEGKMIDAKQSMITLQVMNYVDNQLILKILSDKFDVNLSDYKELEKKWQEEALDLLSTRD
ncbi:hypothetical protein [Wenyingzhuangia marina]|uniref:Uncharacterized protein n=1 Tax=Wenyingzhuangia marina TaxID=1195760 RepID=A0A1M5VJA0_9FLAO|nr:hypothetical protein [Wenyingzhuangia marina]GGF71792.1 hypothetical protein GCM10011397_13340 [Wenyingzhuangia marina]SHH75362.1 hypothetical protein SAMN05444281_1850 [Wenyingzhuangia marina]